MPLEAFAREFLFSRLDVTDFEWMTYKNGKIAAAAGLRLRPRDAAKIGQLVLSDGAWNGRQVIPPDWIMQSVIPRFQAVGYFGGTLFYGYQWWMGRSLAGGKEVRVDRRLRLGRPAHLRHSRARHGRDDDIRPVRPAERRPGAARHPRQCDHSIRGLHREKP